MHKPEVSVIQSVKSPIKSGTLDLPNSKKRIAGIYNNKNNFKGERLFKLAL